MNVLTYPMPMILPTTGASKPRRVGAARQPLVIMENVVEYIGDDPDIQRQVFDLCLDLLRESLPRLDQAIAKGDVATVRQLAHKARGSLGMLGMPALRELSEDIEYRYDSLGLARWQQRCHELKDMFEDLQLELQDRLAA
jgi:HPt (histidine-containing phosphotransfer) domain-containing protein